MPLREAGSSPEPENAWCHCLGLHLVGNPSRAASGHLHVSFVSLPHLRNRFS